MSLLTTYPLTIDFGTYSRTFETREEFMAYCREDTLFLDQEEEFLEKCYANIQ